MKCTASRICFKGIPCPKHNKKSNAINGQAVKFGIYNQKGEFKDAIVYQKNSGSIKLKKIKKDINKTLSELSDSEKQSLLFELLKKEMNI